MESLARRPERVMLGSVFIGVALVLGKLVVGLLTAVYAVLASVHGARGAGRRLEFRGDIGGQRRCRGTLGRCRGESKQEKEQDAERARHH